MAAATAVAADEVPQLKYRFLLSCSLLLNLFFLSSFYYHLLYRFPDEGIALGWSRRAASQAEVVGAISCSGHGTAFLDGVPVGGEGRLPRCECYACFAGDDCSDQLPDCPADADSGDPLFLQPYWMDHAAAGAVVVAGWHRMSYKTDAAHFITVELERHVRLLHAAVGNAVTEGRFIIFGAGSTQLINAAVRALSPENSTTPARVVASIPYYPLYKLQTDLLDSREFEWRGATSDWLNASASSSAGGGFVEFVTSPNNPDCLLHKPVLRGSSVIYDHAYYWPHYTAIPAAADGDVMLFTMSKISGHAGSRCGWAIVKNESVYNRMALYIDYNTFGVSKDTQLRVLTLMKAVIEGIRSGGAGEDDIFLFGRRLLQERWRRLNEVVSASSGRFSLPQMPRQYCIYANGVPDPSPAYAWVKCEMEEDDDCYAVLRSGGVIGRQGSFFGAGPRYVRLSLLRSRDDFDLLLRRLEALVGVPVASKKKHLLSAHLSFDLI